MESVVEFESYRVCLADSFVGRLGRARPGRLITEAGTSVRSRPALGVFGKLRKAEQHLAFRKT